MKEVVVEVVALRRWEENQQLEAAVMVIGQVSGKTGQVGTAVGSAVVGRWLVTETSMAVVWRWERGTVTCEVVFLVV